MDMYKINVNPITKRIFIKISDVLLVEAMSLGIGREESVWSQHDVLRNSRGCAVVSATTLSGNFRHALLENGANKEHIDKLFGDTDEAGQSRLWIYDAEIANAKIRVRDFVALSEGKTSLHKKKFDSEVVEKGAKFTLRMELILREMDKREMDKREMDKEEDILTLFKQLILLLTEGKVRIGAKSTRGVGRIKADPANTKLCICNFEKQLQIELNRWLAFAWDTDDNWTPLESNWLSNVHTSSFQN